MKTVIRGRIVKLGEVIQGHAEVIVDGIGKVGFVEQGGCTTWTRGWRGYDNDGNKVGEFSSIKRSHAVQELAAHAIKTTYGKEHPGMIRTKFLDPDYRRQPKTNHFCCRCQKDLPADKPARTVHLINGGATVLHPDDEEKYAPVETSGDMGCFPIGPECARILGTEWTHRP